MSGKYVFSKSLKELRFLFCQTSEQSAATRHVLNHPFQFPNTFGLRMIQEAIG